MKWIQWLIDHAWTVIIIGGVLTQLFQAIFKPKGDPAASPEEPGERTFEDPELAEQTRRIRQEIQRKIAQRTQRQAAVDPEDVPPYLRDGPMELDDVPVMARSSATTERQAAILAEQEEWAEKLREAQRLKKEIQQRSTFASSPIGAGGAKTGMNPVRGLVRADLASPDALRRALVLREVLGPPVALRD